MMEVDEDISKVYGKERFVVFLDIMGFKDRVARTEFKRLVNDLSDFSSDIRTIINEQLAEGGAIVGGDSGSSGDSKDVVIGSIDYAQFSDSIILFSSDGETESLRKISLAAIKIMQSATGRGYPLKGAIAKGIVYYNKTKQLYFGQALIDAFQLEENVKYYGIVVHHSAEDAIMRLCRKDSKCGLYRDEEVSLKSGNIKHYNLQWYKHDISTFAVKEQLAKIRMTVSDSPRIYIDNTLKLINKGSDKKIK